METEDLERLKPGFPGSIYGTTEVVPSRRGKGRPPVRRKTAERGPSRHTQTAERVVPSRHAQKAAAQESLRQPLRGSRYPKNGIDCPLGHGV